MTYWDRDDYTFTASVGDNSKTFASVLRIYAMGGDVIADVTYGKGVFWKLVDVDRYELHATDIKDGVDCRRLPYDDESIDIVVLDPPYAGHDARGGATLKASIKSQYRTRMHHDKDGEFAEGVLGLYQDAMTEACRVLVCGGSLIVKCQDEIESGKQKWNHVTILNFGTELGLEAVDLFVVVNPTQPALRWKHQLHARKNHSYFWVFDK